MFRFWRLTVAFLCLLLGVSTTALAETRYVSDQLVVSLRSAPRSGAEIIKYLRTDDPVEILSESDEYSQVRTADNDVGYIKKQYLTSDTPKSIIVRRLSKERDQLAAKIKDLEAQLVRATTKGGELQKEIYAELQTAREQLAQQEAELKQLRAELKTVTRSYRELQNNAKNVVAITNERNRLRASNQELQAKVTQLEEERDSLMQTGVIKWFFAGAGVLFVGWIIGKMSRSRRRPSLL